MRRQYRVLLLLLQVQNAVNSVVVAVVVPDDDGDYDAADDVAAAAAAASDAVDVDGVASKIVHRVQHGCTVVCAVVFDTVVVYTHPHPSNYLDHQTIDDCLGSS